MPEREFPSAPTNPVQLPCTIGTEKLSVVPSARMFSQGPTRPASVFSAVPVNLPLASAVRWSFTWYGPSMPAYSPARRAPACPNRVTPTHSNRAGVAMKVTRFMAFYLSGPEPKPALRRDPLIQDFHFGSRMGVSISLSPKFLILRSAAFVWKPSFASGKGQIPPNWKKPNRETATFSGRSVHPHNFPAGASLSTRSRVAAQKVAAPSRPASSRFLPAAATTATISGASSAATSSRALSTPSRMAFRSPASIAARAWAASPSRPIGAATGRAGRAGPPRGRVSR